MKQKESLFFKFKNSIHRKNLIYFNHLFREDYLFFSKRGQYLASRGSFFSCVKERKNLRYLLNSIAEEGFYGIEQIQFDREKRK